MEVRLYGRFAARMGTYPVGEAAVRSVPVAEGDTIHSILRRLGINPADVSHLFLNAQYSGVERKVKPGDRLGVFPKEMGLLYRQYFPRIEE